jgi:hypothetical protein
MSWEVWLRSQHPLYQTLFRALQSIGSRAENGADTIVRTGKTSDCTYVEVRMKRMEFTLEYDSVKKELRAVWETKTEGENVTEWKAKRSSIFAPNEEAVREFLEKLVDVILVQIRNSLPPENLYLMLRPLVESLRGGGGSET